MQNFRSLSAVAGLALAVIFSWKLFRPPSGHHTRQRKRQTSAAGNSDNGTSSNSQLITSATCSPSDDAGVQNVDNEFCGAVKVSGDFSHLLPDLKFLKDKYIFCAYSLKKFWLSSLIFTRYNSWDLVPRIIISLLILAKIWLTN